VDKREPSNLFDAFSICAEIIKQMLAGRSTAEIIDSIDVNEEHLANIAADMIVVCGLNNDLAMVLNDGETYTNISGCSIRQMTEEFDEDGEFVEDTFGDPIIVM
jgi:hypothetical protein